MVHIPLLPRLFDFDTGDSQSFYVKMKRLAEGKETTVRLAVVGMLRWVPDQKLVSVNPLAIQFDEASWLGRSLDS